MNISKKGTQITNIHCGHFYRERYTHDKHVLGKGLFLSVIWGRTKQILRYSEIRFIPSRISMIKKMESKSRPGIWRNVANSNKTWANTCGKQHGRDSSLDS